MQISEFKQVKDWKSCWRWHQSVDSPLGRFHVDLRMEINPRRRPEDAMVGLAAELVRFVEAHGEKVLDVVFGEYLRLVRYDPGWMEENEVPLDLPRERMKEFVSASALAVEQQEEEEGRPYKTVIYVPPLWDEEHGMSLKVEGGRIVAINDAAFEIRNGVVKLDGVPEAPAPAPTPARPTKPWGVPVPAIAAMEYPPAHLGQYAERWLKEAKECGFEQLGWLKVTIYSACTQVTLANADGSVRFVMFSGSYGGDFYPTGVEMCSYFPGHVEVTTSLFAIPPSDLARGIHRHTVKAPNIGELLREHLAHVARVNLSLTDAAGVRNLAEFMAELLAEIHRKLGQGK